MIQLIKDLGPIIVGLLGLFLGFIYNQRASKQKQYEDEKKEIYKKLNSFYGPFQQLRGISSEFYDRLRSSHDNNFRTLTMLLDGYKFEGNDKIILEQILAISKKIDDLILDNSGLVDNTDLRRTLSKVGAHIRILQLAYEGNLTGKEERFKDSVFPREIDNMIEGEIERLKQRLKKLNSL